MQKFFFIFYDKITLCFAIGLILIWWQIYLIFCNGLFPNAFAVG